MTRKQAIDFLINRPADFGKMLGFTKLGSLHNEWMIDMIRGKEDATLQASRGTYKTTCVSIALALIIILLPNKRTLFLRKTDSDIKEVIKQVQKILRDEHTMYFVQCIYGVQLKLLVASSTDITTNLTTDIKGTNQLVGVGIGSSLTGKHYDRIFTDDIVNVNDRISKTERERTKIVYQELQNVKNRGGRIFNTGTPWHADDCFAIMPEAKKYNCYHEEIRKIISKEELEDIKSKMLPSLFAANYELRHIASEDVIFTDPKVGADPAMIEHGIMHIDSAFYGEDYTAWGIMKKCDGKFYMYGKMRRKHVEECYADVMQDYERFMASRLYTENNADKGFVASALRGMGCRVQSYAEKQNKYLKIVTHLKAIWNDLYFVEGTDKAFIDQICDYFEQAEHDDAPDCAASLARIVTSRGTNEDYKPIFG